MADPADDVAVHIPATTMRKKKSTRQQKREELEREVSTLGKMVDHEHKRKKIVAELVMVEGEITRLESQISHLQTDLDQEKEVTKESKSKQWIHETLNKSHIPLPLPPNLSQTNKGFIEKMAFETKALHFINKAIKGNYNLSDFSIHEKLRNSRGFSDHKENRIHEVGFQERSSRKSGMLKAASPFRDPRHVTPQKERIQNPIDLPSKTRSTPIHQSEEESIHKLAPNKLSENIMKCLINIFVRLLRTSRAMEVEKSGVISRSASFSLNFRADISLNTKANLMLQKDSRQQDPYGIFDMEESIPRDIGHYKNLVRFTSTSLDPKCISSSNHVSLSQKLRSLVNNLQKVDLRFLSYRQKLAFWINMYNACIMHGFLQYGVPSSPEKLLTLMNKATLNIGGHTINAQAIEHLILRKPASSTKKEDDKEAHVPEIYGPSSEPNVTFALCCGTRSSPAVKIYTGDGVVAELEKTKLEYLQASIVVTNTKRIAVPELLVQNIHELGRGDNMESLVEWICQQLPTSGSLRKSIVDCFRGLNSGKVLPIIDKIPYEFEFQYLLPM